MNGTHRKTLEKILSDPVNGNIEWPRIESFLKAAGCSVVEGAGSSVTFEFSGRKMTLHRPHPGKEALRYRVLAVQDQRGDVYLAWNDPVHLVTNRHETKGCEAVTGNIAKAIAGFAKQATQ